MRKKRVLWLLNHTTLREFEVPLLVEMGYEIFTPKIFQYMNGDSSATIEWKYDETLSIPSEELETLNKADFYQSVPADIMAIVNKYFDIAMFHYFPEQFKRLVESFKGVLVFQAFGLLGKTSYTDMLIQTFGISILTKLKAVGNRFWYAQAYDKLSEIECQYMQQRTIYMPLGMKDAYVKSSWVGGDSRIFFVCPRINVSKYFLQIYQTFKNDFKGFGYLIGGGQPIEVRNDQKVLGFTTREQYEYNMNHLAAMFYQSRESNHIHYHPFEAVKNGMPLIFMGGGLMDDLGGKNLPGRCETVKEARRKVKKLISGNRSFIKEVTEAQSVLLEHFNYENCKYAWKIGMGKVEKAFDAAIAGGVSQRCKTVAIILPEGYLGGVLDFTVRLIKALKRGADEACDNVSFVFGYLDRPVFEGENCFEEIAQENIPIRKFSWATKDKRWAKDACAMQGYVANSLENEYCVLDDGTSCFEDCDYLIFTADRVPSRVFTTKPYAVVTHDFIQRYLPSIFGNSYEKSIIEFSRNADKVFVTTTATMADAVQYAGIKEDNLELLPLMFDLVESPIIDAKQKSEKDDRRIRAPLTRNSPYFVWSTNASQQKNHNNALQGLSKYYGDGGNLKCYITGVDTKEFDPKNMFNEDASIRADYIMQVRDNIEKNEDLKNNLVFCGNMPKKQYLSILTKAKFVFHPGYADNGNGTVVDAACVGVPSISSDYPAMRYIDSYVGLNMHFFDPFSTGDISQALMEAESKCLEYAKRLPTRGQLEKFTVEGTYKSLYEKVSLIAGIRGIR